MKPCAERHPVSVIGCPACDRADNDPAYQRLWGIAPTGPTFPCLHLGEPTGETVDCPTCPKAAKKTAAVHACSSRGRCAPSLDRHHEVTGCGACSDKSPAKPVLQTIKVNIPGHDQAFNPSIIDHGGKLLFCYRDRWAGSSLWICELDRETLQPTSAGRRLTIQHPRCRAGQEDPRLFVLRGRLHVQFSGVEVQNGKTIVSVMLARLTDDYRVEHVWEPAIDGREEWEKNWGPFEHEGELFSVYHPFHAGSHHIVHHNVETVARFAAESWAPKWTGRDLRGGASPVRVGDEYWSFFHGFPRYTLGLYTFDAAPPFRPRRIIPQPLLAPDGGIGKPVVFPCGATRQGDQWLVSFGRNDQHCEIAVLDHATLEKLLVSVEPERKSMNLPNDPHAPELTINDKFGTLVIPDDQHAPPVYREVCKEDCYGLRDLHASGFEVKRAIDLGASYGVASRMIRHYWPAARIVAYEPDSLRFAFLHRNVPSAVCGKLAVAGFARDRERMLRGIGIDRRWRAKPEEAMEGIDAPIVSVEEAFAGIDHIDLLKIDVEGFELGIVQEMKEMGLLAKTRLIVGEWHFENALAGLREAFADTHDFTFTTPKPGAGPWEMFRATLRGYI